MKDAPEQRAGTVIVRRARPIVVRAPVPPALHDLSLAAEFRRLRAQLAGASPTRREELIRLLNANLRAQKILEVHAPSFHTDLVRKKGDRLH